MTFREASGPQIPFQKSTLSLNVGEGRKQPGSTTAIKLRSRISKIFELFPGLNILS
jgi:hypothetical protein